MCIVSKYANLLEGTLVEDEDWLGVVEGGKASGKWVRCTEERNKGTTGMSSSSSSGALASSRSSKEGVTIGETGVKFAAGAIILRVDVSVDCSLPPTVRVRVLW
jgi:hypothetical protein